MELLDDHRAALLRAHLHPEMRTPVPLIIPVTAGAVTCMCGKAPASVAFTGSARRGGEVRFEGCEHRFRVVMNTPAPGKTPCPLCGGSGMQVQPDGSVKACPRSGDKDSHY